MIQVWTSREWYGHQVSILSVKVDRGKRKLFVVLLKEWYHRCLSIFYLLPFYTWGISNVQFLDTTDNFLTYFKWVNAGEEFSTCMNIINWSMKCHWSWLDVGCFDDILLVAILDNLQQISEELLFSPSLVGGHQAASVLYLSHTSATNFWCILND